MEVFNLKECAVCHEPAVNQCSGCRKVAYCSIDHQKEDWKFHRDNCIFFHIKEDESKSEMCLSGKYCVASRDIPAGTIILDEKPLYQQYPDGFLPFTCVTCGIDLRGLGLFFSSCSRCASAVCSRQCQSLSIHADNECKILRNCDKNKKFPGFIRAQAFKNQNPKLWTEMMDILHWDKKGTTNNDGHGDDESKIVKTKDDDDEIWYQDLQELMRKHGFRYNLTEDHPKYHDPVERKGIYLFRKASYFTHSCCPVTDWQIGDYPTFKIRIRTVVPVKKGDILTVNHLLYGSDNEALSGTSVRQQSFFRRFKMPCTCSMCRDPTELGTFQSAIVCPSCKPKPTTNDDDSGAGDKESVDPKFGYLLPQDPTDLKEKDPLWECDRCGEFHKLSSFSEEYRDIFNLLVVEMGPQPFVSEHGASGKTFKKKCDELYQKYGPPGGDYLHPNHWMLQKIVRYIRGHYSHPKNYNDSFAPDVPLDPMALMKYQLNLLNVTQPGLSRNRVLVLGAVCDYKEMKVNFALDRYNNKMTVLYNILKAKKDDSSSDPSSDKEEAPSSDLNKEDDSWSDLDEEDDPGSDLAESDEKVPSVEMPKINLEADCEEMEQLKTEMLEVIEMRTEQMTFFKNSPPQRGHKYSVIYALMKKLLANEHTTLAEIDTNLKTLIGIRAEFEEAKQTAKGQQVVAAQQNEEKIEEDQNDDRVPTECAL